ncbi:MAG: DUF1801 domain-containing protein [Bacteroidota bacterium]|nr:DUF1801 domain-containing protein [Bacteroidota bacterium]
MYYNQQVTGYIKKTQLPEKDLLIALRLLIHSTLPDIIESYCGNHPVFSYQKKICYLKAVAGKALLGFYCVKNLQDDTGILKDNGHRFKQLEVVSLKEMNEILITKWIREAASELVNDRIAV